MPDNTVVILPSNSNQALGIGQFALDFLSGKLGPGPSEAVLQRVNLFYSDATLCGLSALALRTNAPSVLAAEAADYRDENGATLLAGGPKVKPEKAIVANCAAVREWDSNGTNFGFNPSRGNVAGEFGHNDFYPVVIAACEQRNLSGRQSLIAMVLLDEIRGRLAEVFSLKSYKIDHVVHGAIASAATYGALLGATAVQIESAIGMFIAHHIPFRAIRSGHQLSDSKGASAAISTEAAIVCMQRSMRGFVGPKDIFRNAQAIFRLFEPTLNDDSPFELALSHSGDDFAVMGMHFKLGLYEHQSAGALQALVNLLRNNPILLEDINAIKEVTITAYEPAFSIIGDIEKRDPHTRQSADHSMVFIVARAIKNAFQNKTEFLSARDIDAAWCSIMLTPSDYDDAALFDPETRSIMAKIAFAHGGPDYDSKYPDGIPTSMKIVAETAYESGLIMYPIGHARNNECNLNYLLEEKFSRLLDLVSPEQAHTFHQTRNLSERPTI